MGVSFEENVVLRGFHLCDKDVWKTPHKEHKLWVKKEQDPKYLKINPYSVASMLRKKDKLILLVVGHIPWGISGFVSF